MRAECDRERVTSAEWVGHSAVGAKGAARCCQPHHLATPTRHVEPAVSTQIVPTSLQNRVRLLSVPHTPFSVCCGAALRCSCRTTRASARAHPPRTRSTPHRRKGGE